MSTREKNKAHGKLNLLVLVVFIGSVLLFAGILGRKYLWGGNKRFIISSSSLEKVIDISELSTARYTYNGIARVYDGKSVVCSIKYSAKVKAGINMKDVDFLVDEEKKTVTVKLPEIGIMSDVVDEDSISFIPDNTKISLKEALTACEDDVRNEALESEELFSAASENLKKTLEALLFPILDTEGYSILWDQ